MTPAEKLLLEGIQEDIRELRKEVRVLAENNSGGMLKHLVSAIVGLVAGFGGGHAPLPWGH